MRKLLLSSFVLFSVMLNAQTSFKSGLLTYTVTGEGTVEVSGADSKDASGEPVTDYVIPEKVENGGVSYSVTAIGEEAFHWSDLKSVTLPQTIESIKRSAFNTARNLTSITLPAGLKHIGEYAFDYAGLTSIKIPDSVEDIGDNAFFACGSLATVELGSGLKSIGEAAFYKGGFSEIELPEGVTSIPTALFYNCANLKSVKLPSGLNTIGKRAFRECTSLASIDLPSSVSYIGEDAFLMCTALTSLQLPASLEEVGVNFVANTGITTLTVESGNENFVADGGVIYSTNSKVLYAAPTKGLYELTLPKSCIGIYGGAFSGSEIKKVTLPEGFLAVDNYAFCESALESINLPSSMVMIGEQAFAATQLTEVTLPERTETLYSAAFAGCEKLTTVTIPSGLRYISNRVFLGCTALKTINCLGATPPELEEIYEPYEDQFYGVSGATLYVPKGCAASYRDAGYGTSLTIEETDKGVFTHVSTTPAAGAKVEPGWMPMSVEVEFAEPVTVVNASPYASLFDGQLAGGREILPDDGWKATVSDKSKNTLVVWGSDFDGFTNAFKAEKGHGYTAVIPAGVVKNAAGELNGQIVIRFVCDESTGIVSTDAPADVKVTARYDLNGRKLDKAVRGINIERLSDGTVRKVVVK